MGAIRSSRRYSPNSGKRPTSATTLKLDDIWREHKVEEEPATFLQGLDRIFLGGLCRGRGLERALRLSVDHLEEQPLLGRKAAIDRLLARSSNVSYVNDTVSIIHWRLSMDDLAASGAIRPGRDKPAIENSAPRVQGCGRSALTFRDGVRRSAAGR